MITQNYDLSGFSFIKIDGNWKVNIEKREDFLVTVTANEQDFKSLIVEVQDETLLLGSIDNKSFKNPIQANIYLPVLQQVEGFGKASIVANGLSNMDIAITLSGKCDAKLSGIVESLTATVSGSSIVNAIPLTCAKAQVNINGTSTVKTSARDVLTVNIAGDGVVEYNNDPKITQNISGKGKVTRTTV